MERFHTSRERALFHLLEELGQQLADLGACARSNNRSQQAEEQVDQG